MIIGNWQLNGITTIRDGQPFTPTASTNQSNSGGAARPNWNPWAGTPGFKPSVQDWFDLAALSVPSGLYLRTYSNEDRDILRGPGSINFDASIFKTFNATKLGEAGRVMLRFEGFNIFNHPNFGIPSNVNVTTAGAGSITTTTTGMRVLQAGIKVIF